MFIWKSLRYFSGLEYIISLLRERKKYEILFNEVEKKIIVF